ncbi:hypothetical protein ACFQZS_13530 [Mucilaginibacter calamicampi]|uniref:CarboxypepD_reg-like domain-containing protein n=1 Tax=Mucilaginibacter calamicampi TaxID=1302352 RepID=A0ABW2YXE6_9SPHI
MKHFILLLSAAFILLVAPAAHAQQKSRKIEGKIVNGHQQPVGGAVIMVYGSYDAILSDGSGAFTLTLPTDRVAYVRVRVKDDENIIKVKPHDKTINLTWDKAATAATLVNLVEIKTNGNL